MKYCACCDRTLSVDAFNLDRTRIDGRDPRCRECRSIYNGARSGAPDFLKLLRLGQDNTDWMADAACAGKDISPDLFFAEGRGQSTHVYKAAKTLCCGCPVRQTCLDYALRHSIQHGVWGGMSPIERRREGRARRRLKVVAA